MSLRIHWVMSCDMRGCDHQFIGSLANQPRSGRRNPAKATTLHDARKQGWGTVAVGKFGQKIHLCQSCREKLQQEQYPNHFYEPIVSKDHTPDHTILLECGHEFSKAEWNKDGLVHCSACRLQWLKSGEVLGLPNLEDLIPTIPE